jgi:hypothetical protein
MHRRHNEQARDDNNKPDYRLHGIASLSKFPRLLTVAPSGLNVNRMRPASTLSFDNEIGARCLQSSRQPRACPIRLDGMRVVRPMAGFVRIQSGRVLVGGVVVA